jgi:hypothetical protein
VRQEGVARVEVLVEEVVLLHHLLLQLSPLRQPAPRS